MSSKELADYLETPVDHLEEGLIRIIANLPYGEEVELPDNAPGFPESLLSGLQRVAFAAEVMRSLYEGERRDGESGLREVSA